MIQKTNITIKTYDNFINESSSYKPGDKKWVFLQKGTYPNFGEEYLIEVEFGQYKDIHGQEAKILRGDNISSGWETISLTTHNLYATKVFDNYNDAKKHMIKFLEYKKDLLYKRADNDIHNRINQIETQLEQRYPELKRDDNIGNLLHDK